MALDGLGGFAYGRAFRQGKTPTDDAARGEGGGLDELAAGKCRHMA
jgi:hypothetical protein